METTLIKNGTAITMDDEMKVLKNSFLLIEGNTIKKIFASFDEFSAYAAKNENREPDVVIEARGKLVLPGFVNAHGHAAMSLFRGYADDLPLMEWLEKRIWPLEAKLKAADIYWGTMLSIVEMLKNGITIFADMYFCMDQVARAVVESGIRGVLSRGMVGTGNEAVKALLESEKFFADWHNAGGGRVKVTLGPHAPYTCPPDYLEKVIILRDKLAIPLQIHLAETAWEVNFCLENYGKSPVELINDTGLFEGPVLAAHCVHLTREDIQILVDKKVKVVHNPKSNLKLASGIAPVSALIAAGVVIALGTDGAASNNNLDMMEEIRLAALLHKGVQQDSNLIPAETALLLATKNGGKSLFNERIGSLEEGKLADLIIINYEGVPHLTPGYSPVADIVYAAKSADIDSVMVDGKIIVEQGKCKHLDEERIILEAQKRAFSLGKR